LTEKIHLKMDEWGSAKGRLRDMQIEPIKQRRLYRQVADQLRNLIEKEHFATGSRLPTERELALQLGISRPTVREALIALEVDGLVDIRGGSGIYVMPQTNQMRNAHNLPVTPVAGPFEILNARALFEGAVADAAALRATPADIAAIDAALNEMAMAQHPSNQSMALDKAFHLAIADILQNDAITRTISDLFDQRINPYFAQLASYFENPTTWQDAIDEHREVRNFIALHDGTGAKNAMQQHLQKSQMRFSENFGEGQSSKPSNDGKTALQGADRGSRAGRAILKKKLQ
jgi:DNA-binding FadR family transcriptional regulator